ncbi:ABC transporter ATP-binding protein [Kordiimonas aquimaris]|uniref:ABC transporter ATP-binding protein n=1 Tax=Kordiimonas aquimaris TaxID=707591 RepID=UPI0021D25FEC|nr:ABC transporter ATP-binding protein [Kordiimonas aquimaris]
MKPAIETREISKRFGAVQANDQISLVVDKGSVHGIVGENGAGKSTLLKMLFGFYTPNSGDILVDGEHCRFSNPTDAMSAGIAMVHQHFMLVEPFTVLENIILGAEGAGLLKRACAEASVKIKKLEEEFGFNLPLDTPVSHLSVGERQRVEILKALYRGAETLILDEPTAVLTPQECDQLFALINVLKSQGKTVLFVTHKLHEIIAVTDAVTVIRGGKVITRMATSETTPDQLAEAMVGAKITRAVEAEDRGGAAQARLRLTNVCALSDMGHAALDSISFELYDGEVLGVAGVAGNGQTELLEVLSGMRRVTDGEVTISGKVTNTSDHMYDPIMLRDMGLAHIAEDRLKTGVVSSMTGRENAVLGYQRTNDFSKGGLLKLNAIADAADTYYETQDVRPRDPDLPLEALSGGNQQKLVIAREIARDPEIMVIGQPTRGVDIGAVTKIHDQIIALRNQGKALLVVSADLDELMVVSDRIAVMCDGKLAGIVPVDQADERTLGLMMAGDASTAEQQTQASV